jgi:predicted transcriptional regulator
VTGQRTLLLSLRPRYADAILDGTKTIEIRRRPVNAEAGTPIILYSSSPVMAVVGTAFLGAVQTLNTEAAWQQHRDVLGVARQELDSYLEGIPNAYLLHIEGVRRLNNPLPLGHLRSEGPFQPPQSFRYLSAMDPLSLRRLVCA